LGVTLLRDPDPNADPNRDTQRNAAGNAGTTHAPTPEPTTIVLFGSGLAALGGAAFRRLFGKQIKSPDASDRDR